jgi:hypothetical protein
MTGGFVALQVPATASLNQSMAIRMGLAPICTV